MNNNNLCVDINNLTNNNIQKENNMKKEYKNEYDKLYQISGVTYFDLDPEHGDDDDDFISDDPAKELEHYKVTADDIIIYLKVKYDNCRRTSDKLYTESDDSDNRISQLEKENMELMKYKRLCNIVLYIPHKIVKVTKTTYSKVMSLFNKKSKTVA